MFFFVYNKLLLAISYHSICKTNMSMLFLFIFFSIGVSIIESSTCQCCIPETIPICQTPAIPLSCVDCTADFCANHVKGCQGLRCNATCEPDSMSTLSSKPTIRFSTNESSIIRMEFFVLSTILTSLILIRLNF